MHRLHGGGKSRTICHTSKDALVSPTCPDGWDDEVDDDEEIDFLSVIGWQWLLS